MAVDQQVYDTITRLQAHSGARTANDAVRLLLGLPATQRRTRAHSTDAINAVLRDHPGSTATEIAQAAGLAYSTTTSILAELKKAGLAHRTPDHTRRRGAITHRWHLTAPSPASAAETAELRELVYTLAQQAIDEAAKARNELAEQLDQHLAENEFELTEAMTTLAYRQPYARWWTTLTHHIQNGLDPATALHKTRDAAHHTLLRLDASTPCTPCPRTRDPLTILRQAVSDFHHDIAPATLHTSYGITLPAGPANTNQAE
jgi:predicted transcriptional regulator